MLKYSCLEDVQSTTTTTTTTTAKPPTTLKTTQFHTTKQKCKEETIKLIIGKKPYDQNASFIQIDGQKNGYIGKLTVENEEIDSSNYKYDLLKVDRIGNWKYNNTSQNLVQEALKKMLLSRNGPKGIPCEPKEISTHFCIDKSKGVILSNIIPIKADTIEKYSLTVEARNNCTTKNITFDVAVTPSCFPMDLLYSNVQSHCPTWDKRRFVDSSAIESWPTMIFKVFVNSGIVLGQIELDSNNIASIIPGRYFIYLKTSVKTNVRTFEYIQNLDSNTGKSSGFLESKVTGTTLKVSFHQEILITKPETISITIDKFGIEHPHLYFKTKNALTLFGSNQLKKCPFGQCLEHFSTWRKAYIELTKKGVHNECIDDPRMYYSYLSYCNDDTDPYITVEPKQPIYKKSVTLKCNGIRIDTNRSSIRWLQEDKEIQKRRKRSEFDKGIFVLSGDNFWQEGHYVCQYVNSRNEMKTSKSVSIAFKDSLHTKFHFQISRQSFQDQKNTKGERRDAFKLLREKIQLIIGRTNTYDHFMVFRPKVVKLKQRNSYWLTFEVETRGHLHQNSSVIGFYQKIVFNDQNLHPFDYRMESFKAFDPEYCLPSTTGQSSSYGQYRWNFTRVGGTQVQQCNYGNATTWRECRRNLNSGAFWREPNVKGCSHESERSRELTDILKNGESPEKASKQLKNLTSNPVTLSTTETILTSSIIQSITDSSQNIDPKVASNMLEIASNVMDVNTSTLEKAQQQGGSLTMVIQSIEAVARKIQFNTSSDENNKNQETIPQIANQNIGLAVLFPQNGDSFKKQKISVKKTQSSNKNGKIKFMKDIDSADSLIDANDGVDIILPRSLLKDSENKLVNKSRISGKTIQLVYFKDSSLFTTVSTNGKKTSNSTVISGVFSLNVGDSERVELSEDLEYSVSLKKNTIDGNEAKNKGRYECVFWDFNANDELGGWSTKGCITIQPNEIDDVTSVVNCQCNHLTNFAVLFTIDGVTTAEKVDSGHELALTLISYIGCGISLACIMMTLLTLALFKPMRRHIPSKVLIGLCTSIGCLIIVFITLIDQTKPSWLCTATSTVLHFLILNCFCWMLVEALTLYLKVVKVMGEYTSKFMLKSLFGTFGVPLFVVTVCLLADKNDYQDLEICMVHGNSLKYGLLLPVGIILFLNSIIFLFVVYRLFKNKLSKHKVDDKAQLASQLRIAVSCCTLLGLTWIFGLLAVGETRLVFQYLFCIFNSLQGAFIFYFNILRQTRTVEAWRGFLAGKGRAYNLTSSGSHSSHNTKSRSTNSKNFRLSSERDSVPLPEFTFPSNNSNRYSDQIGPSSLPEFRSPKLAEKYEPPPLPEFTAPRTILSPDVSDDELGSQASIIRSASGHDNVPQLFAGTPASEIHFTSFVEQ
uniref:Uncharacterized protein n=2 Tax=Clytia hemisphaerica TaxID=252671 RepID=A0A7M5XHC6_9CNID